ncbi:WfbF [Treponema primitia ZAS-2]|uniref:WfbF n=1 Tax=Treponema primitia (strain ATCC BAA-887 / DSM 12427 / ZAS-2) TaxID=545694 RepID=F5YMC8_TREPZ|nr:glycosyltransferase [Treponema primitia]AEF84125.1 WfbF [Treponema primitia ZAS-2]
MKGTIVVNASALRIGGALTILYQFIAALPDDDYQYIVFVHKSIENLQFKLNLRIIYVDKSSPIKRVLWDAFGLRNWLKLNNIIPIASVSLQNTSFRINNDCPNFIYFHQLIPLYPYKWTALSYEQIKRFFVNKILYKYFVKRYFDEFTEIFVQLKCTKDAFVKTFKFNQNRVHIIYPSIYLPEPVNKSGLFIDNQKLNIFFPATPYSYKNHSILIKTFKYIDILLKKKITLYLTCSPKEIHNPYSFKNIDIIFLGTLKHSEVVCLYTKLDVLVFPSFLESFGLPLIEAASFGLPIIASDLPYAREVLKDYSGATFVKYNDYHKWGKELLRLSFEPKNKYKSLKIDEKKSWNELYKIIEKKICNYNAK